MPPGRMVFVTLPCPPAGSPGRKQSQRGRRTVGENCSGASRGHKRGGTAFCSHSGRREARRLGPCGRRGRGRGGWPAVPWGASRAGSTCGHLI